MFKKSKIALILILCASLLLSFTSCGSPPPDISEVSQCFEELIESSYEINEIFFGAGLPTNEDVEDVPDDFIGYVYVSDDAKYKSIDEIKQAASLVYSSDYLQYIYQSVFTGYVDQDTGIVLTARYHEDSGRLLQADDTKPLYFGTTKYDYSTMKIVRPSSSSYVIVEMTAWVEGIEDIETSDDFSDEYNDILSGKKHTVRLSFAKQDGKWLLDTPTY